MYKYEVIGYEFYGGKLVVLGYVHAPDLAHARFEAALRWGSLVKQVRPV